jgi:hypothetical protein
MGDESNVVSIAAWLVRRAAAQRAPGVVRPAGGSGSHAAIQLPVGHIVSIRSRRDRERDAETTVGPGSGTAA